MGGRVQRDMWRDNGFPVKRGAAADDWGQKCARLHLRCLVIGCCVCVSLPLYQSSEASSQPLPCPWISRGLCRRSRSCLLRSSRRRAGPHALSAQTTSQGTTWHTDSRAHKHTHARTEAHTRTHTHTRSPPLKKKVCRLNWRSRLKSIQAANQRRASEGREGEAEWAPPRGSASVVSQQRGKKKVLEGASRLRPVSQEKVRAPPGKLPGKGSQRLVAAISWNYSARGAGERVRSRSGANTLFKYGHWHSGHSFLDNCDYKKLPPNTHTHTRRKSYIPLVCGGSHTINQSTTKPSATDK